MAINNQKRGAARCAPKTKSSVSKDTQWLQDLAEELGPCEASLASIRALVKGEPPRNGRERAEFREMFTAAGVPISEKEVLSLQSGYAMRLTERAPVAGGWTLHVDRGRGSSSFDDDTRGNPKRQAAAVKPKMYLIPYCAAVEVARALETGADKYGPYDWRSGEYQVKASDYVSAAYRHLGAWLEGEDIDPESGCSHLAHVLAGMFVLLDAKIHGQMDDDRP